MDDTFDKYVGSLMKYIRKSKEMTQNEISISMGKCRTWCSDFERG